MKYEIINNPKLFPYSKESDKKVKQFSSVEVNEIDGTSDDYLKIIRKYKIDFPYKRNYIDFSYILDVFDFIGQFRNIWFHKKYNISKTESKLPIIFYKPIFENNKLTNFEKPKYYIDCKSHGDLDLAINVITDYFSEFARTKCSRYDKQSVYQGWIKNDEFVKECLDICINKYQKIDSYLLREAIYETKAYDECVHMKVTFLHNIYHLLLNNVKNPKVLDPCAGWGDRLITCIRLKYDYIGVEPNTRMFGPYKKKKKKLGKNNKKYKLFRDYMPDADIGVDNKPYFNLIHFSPPSYTSEIYEPTGKGQSITLFSEKNKWMIEFLFKTINRSWSLLKENGYLIIQSLLIDEIFPYIRYRFTKEAIFLGALSVKRNSRNQPFWIFVKSSNIHQPHKLMSKEKALKSFNNNIQKMLKNREDIYY